MTDKLTRRDAVALWHAVEAFKDLVRVMPGMDGVSDALIDAEVQLLAEARAALRKVQAIVREAAQAAAAKEQP